MTTTRCLALALLTIATAPRAHGQVADVQSGSVAAPTTQSLPSVSSVDAGPPQLPAGRDWQLTLYEENDKFLGTDSNYTQGFKAILTTRAPDALRGLGEWIPPFDGHLRSLGLAFGQQIYTPEDWPRRDWDPFDRPYAAWMYLGAIASFGGTDGLFGVPFESFLELDVGVLGPLALGEQVQDTWHGVIGAETFAGWDNQIEDELGVLFTYQRSWLVFHATLTEPGRGLPAALGLEVDVQPHLGLRLGNVATYPNAGLQLRLGHGLLQARRFVTTFESFGEEWERPRGEGRAAPDERPGSFPWYVYGRVDGRYVVYDAFTDGNLTRASHSIPREDLVLDLELGFALELFRRVTLGYAFTARSPQFKGQGGFSRYGSFTISIAW